MRRGVLAGRARIAIALGVVLDDPTAESDLAAYRSFYGLPPCTTANGCFRKVNQTGGTVPPAAQPGLGARDLARPRHGQRGLPELPDPPGRGERRTSTATSTRPRTPRRGSARTRSATAGAATSPATRPPTTSTSTIPASRSPRARATTATASRTRPPRRYVTAVGGTSLSRGRARAAGPSPPGAAPAAAAARIEPKPSWQTDTGCARRTVADVSAVADPNTGVAVLYADHAGSRSAARAPRRRSSPASTRSRATRRA